MANEKSSRESFVALLIFVKERLDKGRTQDQIAKDLVKKGIPEPKATETVVGLIDYLGTNPSQANAIVRTYRAEKGISRMVQGGIFLLLGGGVTVYTYVTAPPGGTYTLAWGGILFGALMVIEGFFGWMNNK